MHARLQGSCSVSPWMTETNMREDRVPIYCCNYTNSISMTARAIPLYVIILWYYAVSTYMSKYNYQSWLIMFKMWRASVTYISLKVWDILTIQFNPSQFSILYTVFKELLTCDLRYKVLRITKNCAWITNVKRNTMTWWRIVTPQIQSLMEYYRPRCFDQT